MENSKKVFACRAGEGILLLLLAVWITGGIPWFPKAWLGYFDFHPKVYRKLLTFAVGVAVFLGVALLEWARRDGTVTRASLLVKIEESWKAHAAFWIAGIFFVFGSLWTVSSCFRHESLNSGFDMAIFTQAISNTARGDWFYSSIKGGISLLGDHFAPLLAVYAMPYKIWPDPDLLLGIQAFGAASCVFPLAKIVRRTGQSQAWAVLFCVLYVLYLPVRNSVRFEFHPEVPAMPFFFWAFAFLQDKKMGLTTIFLALALMAKENVATVVFGFGFYAVFFAPSPAPTPGTCSDRAFWGPARLWGIGWMVASVLYFYAVVHLFIPELSGAPYAYLSGNFTEWLHAGWGPFMKHMGQASTFSYLAKIYGPLAFTSVLAPASVVLTLPTLAQNLLSRNEMTRSVLFQYTSTLTPVVFIASVMSLAKVRLNRRYWAYLLLVTSVLTSGVSEVYHARRYWRQITPHVRMVKKILAAIPSSSSLRTHEFFAAHATVRKELHIYENNNPKEGGSWKARHTDLVAIDRMRLEAGFDAARRDLERSGFLAVFEQNGFVLFEKADSRVDLSDSLKKFRS